MDSIAPFDIIVLTLLGGLTFWGGISGIIAQITSIISLVLSIYVGSHYGEIVASKLPIQEEWQRNLVALVLLFFGTMIVVHILLKFFQKFINLVHLKEFNRQLGALFGFLKGILLCLLITFICVVATEKTCSLIQMSKSGPYFVIAISYFEKYVPGDKAFQEVLQKGFERFKQIAAEHNMSTDTTNIRNMFAQSSRNLSKLTNASDTSKPAQTNKDNISVNSLKNKLNSVTEYFSFFSTENNTAKNATFGTNQPATDPGNVIKQTSGTASTGSAPQTSNGTAAASRYPFDNGTSSSTNDSMKTVAGIINLFEKKISVQDSSAANKTYSSQTSGQTVSAVQPEENQPVTQTAYMDSILGGPQTTAIQQISSPVNSTSTSDQKMEIQEQNLSQPISSSIFDQRTIPVTQTAPSLFL